MVRMCHSPQVTSFVRFDVVSGRWLGEVDDMLSLEGKKVATHREWLRLSDLILLSNFWRIFDSQLEVLLFHSGVIQDSLLLAR